MLFGFQDVDARDRRGHDASITQGRWYRILSHEELKLRREQWE
jgi:hypothetical protein